jgi:hypothetical protein
MTVVDAMSTEPYDVAFVEWRRPSFCTRWELSRSVIGDASDGFNARWG